MGITVYNNELQNEQFSKLCKQYGKTREQNYVLLEPAYGG